MLATLGTGQDVFKLYDSAIVDPPTTSYTVDPPGPLGNCVVIPNNSKGLTIGYVTAAGALIDGSSSGHYEAAATDVKVELLANSGDMFFVLVKNTTGSTIERGSVVAHGLLQNFFDVVLAPTTCPHKRMVGVAQWDIPTGKSTYVLCKGVGQVLSGGITDAQNLKADTGTAGRLVDAAAIDGSAGLSHSAATAGNLATARIDMM